MLKLKNIVFANGIITMLVLIEGNENRAYKLTFRVDGEHLVVVDSEIPDGYKIYERQAKVALHEYDYHALPTETTSMWV